MVIEFVTVVFIDLETTAQQFYKLDTVVNIPTLLDCTLPDE